MFCKLKIQSIIRAIFSKMLIHIFGTPWSLKFKQESAVGILSNYALLANTRRCYSKVNLTRLSMFKQIQNTTLNTEVENESCLEIVVNRFDDN